MSHFSLLFTTAKALVFSDTDNKKQNLACGYLLVSLKRHCVNGRGSLTSIITKNFKSSVSKWGCHNVLVHSDTGGQFFFKYKVTLSRQLWRVPSSAKKELYCLIFCRSCEIVLCEEMLTPDRQHVPAHWPRSFI